MRKSPFVFFVIIMSLVIGSIISFIQGPGFARVVKSVFVRYVPSDLGVSGDFEGLDVKLFPPGLSIRKPQICVTDHNMAGLPPGSVVTAERIDLEFRPVQIFSGNIRVHEVTIVDGDVKLLLGDVAAKKSIKRPTKSEFHWDELLQIHAEALSLKNTKLHIEATNPSVAVDLRAEAVRLGQWSGRGGLGYEVSLDLKDISGTFLKGLPIPQSIESLFAVGHVNAAGLVFDKLDFQAPGLKGSFKGLLKGNLLEAHGLSLESEIQASGDLLRISEVLFPSPQGRPPASGEVTFIGKVSLNPLRLEETLKIQGELRGKSVHFQEWTADHIKSELLWESLTGGGRLSVAKATMSETEVPRFGGRHPGGGGKIEVGPFKLDVVFGKSLATLKLLETQVPVTLENAHIHWLTAPVLKQLYPLDVRLSGPLALEFHPASALHSWTLGAKVDLQLAHFQLDNQHLNQDKPLSKVLQIEKARIQSDVLLTASAVHLQNTTITVGSTLLSGGGKIDFKSGFDLKFAGPINLDDVHQLAENEIHGKGTLVAYVHGPSSSVVLDFDHVLQEAEYLKLRFGGLKGRVTWDDDRDPVILTGMVGERGRTTI